MVNSEEKKGEANPSSSSSSSKKENLTSGNLSVSDYCCELVEMISSLAIENNDGSNEKITKILAILGMQRSMD